MRNRTQQKGQGMTEYIIIVAMVAIAAIIIFQLFGKTIRAKTADLINSLAGGKPTATEGDKISPKGPDQGLDPFFQEGGK